MHSLIPPSGPPHVTRTGTVVAATASLLLGSLVVPVAGATAVEGGTMRTSFETGDPAVAGEVETGPDGQPLASGVVRGDGSPGLGLTVDDGPDTSYAAKNDVGFTGLRALRFSGTHQSEGDAHATSVVLDVDVPVGEDSELSYVIFPELDEQVVDYASTYVAVDLAFTDGTYLSDLGAVDHHGIGMDARSQGESGTLYPRQWNRKSTDLGAVAAGKTVDRVLLAYDGPHGPAPVGGWIDDIEIADGAPVPHDARPSDWVDTRRGTNSTGGGYSRGNNFPAVAWPNGFNFWTPMTDASSRNTLYHYQERNNAQNLPVIQAFAASHQPSIWMTDRQTFQFMPSVATGVPDADRTARGLAFTHDDEVATAHHYDVTFQNGLRAQITPTDHAAAFRFTFPEDGGSTIILDNVNDAADYTVDAETGTFSGWSDTKSAAWSSVGMQRMFIYGEFSEPVTEAADIAGQRTATSYVSFDAATVEMRVATSLISLDQAKRNLELEIADDAAFEDVVANAQDAWDERLGVIEVEDATEDQLRTLYSNLYRINLYPNSAYENVGTAAEPVYQHADQSSDDWDIAPGTTPTRTGARILDGKIFVNTGFWDTFRTAWPSYALLWPETAGELVDGFVQQYRDGGWVSPWSSPGYARVMTGTSSDSAFADAYVKGVPGLNARDTYDAALKNATVRPESGAIGRHGLEESIFLGYVPNDLGSAAFAWSKDGAMNDFAIARMAEAMAQDPATPEDERARLDEEAEYLLSRSQEYVHLFDASTGFFQGRSREGEWTTSSEEYDPGVWGNDHDYAEANGWNEVFPAPYDGQGLAELFGGDRSALADKLDEFFSTPELGQKRGSYGGIIHEMREARDLRLGQWAIANQVSYHIPWMYNFTQQPWKGQEQVRAALQRGFVGSEIGQGYPGDEDNGASSSWYVMSALGLYPLTMASGEYAIGSPLFERATLHLPGGDVVIEAPGASEGDVYVQSLTIDGEDHSSTVVTHDELADGATLRFTMGDQPGPWGTGEDDVPGSVTAVGGTPDPMEDVTGAGRGVATASGGDAGALFDDTSATQATITGDEPWVGYRVSGGSEVPVHYYTLTSGTDPALDPSHWVLEGSDDGESWTVLDERTDQEFVWRQQTRPFRLADDASMDRYRVRFLGTAGRVQLAEVELLTQAEVPTAPVALEVGSTDVRPGRSGQVDVTLTSVGDEAATVDLSMTLDDGWTVEPGTATVEVPAGESVTTTVVVTPSDDAAPRAYTLTATAVAGPWSLTAEGTVRLVGDVVEIVPTTPEEAAWLVQDSGSQTTDQPARYTDEQRFFVYEIPLAGATSGTITVDIANQYLVSASADRETWVEVLRAEGSPINDGNRAKHVLDVADLLGRTGSDGTLYLRFADSTPADGWGGKLFLTRLEVSRSTEPTPQVEVEVAPRCLAGKVYVAVRATNAGEEPVDVTVSTPYGEKSFTGVEPGQSAYQSFASRASGIDAATVSVTATLPGGEPHTQEVEVAAHTC